MKVYSTQLNSNLMPYFTRAAKEAGQQDVDAVHMLCRRLSGIESTKCMEVGLLVKDIKMPDGYLHMRLFDEATMEEFAAAWAAEPGTRITPALIAMQVMLSEDFLENRWIATLPLLDHPYAAKGVLDLAIRFAPRSTALRQFDIL